MQVPKDARVRPTAERVREAWPYLRPLGDRALVADGLASIEPDEENLQPMIEILLHILIYKKLERWGFVFLNISSNFREIL